MRTIAVWLFGLGLAPAGAAQGFPGFSLAPGYGSELTLDQSNDPQSFRGFVIGAQGGVYAGIDRSVVEIGVGGQRFELHQFAAGDVALLEAYGNEIWALESGTETFWRRNVVTGAEAEGRVPLFTFDLAGAPGGEVLASANPDWPSSLDAAIWLVDPASSVHRKVIDLVGPSGPLAFDPRGDLYYAAQSPIYPSPPGSVRIVRFSAAQLRTALQGGPALSLADATTVIDGLDGAYGLALDDRGRLYWSDPQSGLVLRSLPAAGARDPLPLLAPLPAAFVPAALQLQYVERGTPTFDPFQPDSGGSLFVAISNWTTRCEVRALRGRRPAVASAPAGVAPPGPIAFQLSALPSNGPAWLCATPLAPLPERSLFIWNGTPFWSGLDFWIPPVCVPLLADPTGAAQLRLHYRGGVSGALHFQVIGFDPASWPFGTSPVYSLTLLP